MRRQKDLSVCQHLGPRPASLSCVLEWSSQADTMPLMASSGCLPVPPSPRWIPLFLPPSVALCSLWEGLSYSPEALAVGGVMGWMVMSHYCRACVSSDCTLFCFPCWLPLLSHPHMGAAPLEGTMLCPHTQNNPGQRIWGLSSRFQGQRQYTHVSVIVCLFNPSRAHNTVTTLTSPCVTLQLSVSLALFLLL